MTTEKDIYKNRDMLLGEIHAKVERIPELEKSVNRLGRKVAVIEFKSGLWGVIGGFGTMLALYFKDHILNWRG